MDVHTNMRASCANVSV